MSDLIIYNGTLISRDELPLSHENRGMMYGDGFFDTLRSYSGRFLHLEEHFTRILKTAGYLGINVHFEFEDFKFKLIELLEASNLRETDALVRVQCWRDGSRGYSTGSKEANWVTSSELLSISKDSISLSSVNTRAIPSKALERKFKLSNGLNYIVAAREATESGSDDALMYTIDDKVSETTISNIFWVKGNQVYTPSADCDLLPGITRNIIIGIVNESEGLDLLEGNFTKENIMDSEAIFCTNSLREIRAVHLLDGKSFETNHPILTTLKDSFSSYKLRELK
ncbi:MAG: aminotransferase class IV [Balneolaceae bacterium]